MGRKPMVTGITVAGMLLATVGVGRTAGASPIPLLVPASTAFSALGHSCGGIQEQALATGFDPATSHPTGDVYLQTRCGGSGRGGGYHVTTYSAWIGVTWDDTGAVIASTVEAAPATVDPTFTAFDASGNEVYNQLTAVNVLPANCTVGNTTYCAYRAYLSLAPGFVPPPRVTGVSVTSGPATGGTTVALTGTGFTGATAVDFGGTPASTFTVNGDTSITAVSPAASAGTVDVTVTSAGGTSAAIAADRFTFVDAPVVSSIDPSGGPMGGGTLVTITGASFVDVVAVDFGETPAGFTVNDDSSITAMSPPGEALDTVHVTVATVGGTSARSAADTFTYTQSTPISTCGDGTVDPGEECDDGAANGAPGDCCTIACQFQPAGTACTDDGDLCTADACDGAGACLHAAEPSPACTPPDVTAGASLLMRSVPPGRNQAQFRWGKGPAVALADFGDPTGGDQLRLCVYEQVAPGGWAIALGGSPSASGGAWMGSPTGWKFMSATGAPDGVTGVRLKASMRPLVARVQVQAKGNPAFPMGLPLQTGAGVVVQLRTSLGMCWGATFSNPMMDTATAFKASSD